MVASPRQERPRTADPLVNQFAAMQRQLNELSRRGPSAMWDGNGADAVSLDQAAGWGLRNPTLDAVMYPDAPDAPTVTTGSLKTLWHAYFPILHPRLVFSGLLVTKGAGTVAGLMQWVLTTPSVGTYTTDPVTFSGVGSVQDDQVYDFAEADQGETALLQLQVQMTGTVVGGNYAFGTPLSVWRVRSTYPD